MALAQLQIKTRLYRDSFTQTNDSADSNDSQQPNDGQPGPTYDLVNQQNAPVSYRTA